ncbi:hypothetical protein [Chitinophaga sancti]|uniref:hypothetical protein n=1 Tax=Chitinophaga sancti TaxID=1004 RepID=UPI003F7B1B90
MALSKIFTGRFYAANAAIFFLVFYFFFGIVPGNMLLSYHLTLIRGFTGNTDFLCLVLLGWTVYNAKCALFVLKTLSARESLYLYATLGVLDGQQKWLTWFRIHFSLYMPALVYSSAAVWIALRDKHIGAAVTIVLFQALMSVVPLFVYDRKIKNPGTTSLFIRWQQKLNRLFTKPLWAYYLYELLNNGSRSLFITKGVTGLVIIATYSLMEQPYELRFMLVGLLLVLLAHTVLVFNHRQFDDLKVSIAIQLPLPLWKRYVHTTFGYFVLLLPEFIFLAVRTYQVAGPLDQLLFICLSVSMLVMWRMLLYFPRLDQDKYFRWVLISIVISLFMILGYLYWYVVIGWQVLAFTIFATRYYKYEPPLAEVQ